MTATKQGGTPQQIFAGNYHESGRLADYTTGSATLNVKTTIAAGSVIPSRPASFASVSTISGTLWPAATYAYDGAGSIKTIGTSADSFIYEARSRLTSATYASGAGTQTFGNDRYGNLTSKGGINPITLTTSTSTNHLTGATYDDRGNLVSLATNAVPCAGSPDTVCYDALNRMTRTLNSVPPPATDFTYLYDGGGERVAKFSSLDGATRRELARILIEGRGDTPLSCVNPGPFTDVTCAANPNDGKYVQKLKDIGITAGCGGTTFCPDATTLRQEAAVFYLRAEHFNLTPPYTYTPPPCTPPPNQRFADVPCPSQYADWIEQLAYEGITSGCGNGNFCPTTAVGTFNMLAWAAAIWPSYNPLPRDAVLTYRDQNAHVITEANQALSTTDTSQNLVYSRDNIFLGSQLIASGLWSGTAWTTLNYHFYASDHLGTPRLVTDIGANLVQLRKFWPYGDDGPSSGSESFQRLKLAGMERDGESKNYYDHARVENFNVGRFLSPDLLRGDPEYPQSWNRYSYVLNNPMNLTDPWGFRFDDGCIFEGQCYWPLPPATWDSGVPGDGREGVGGGGKGPRGKSSETQTPKRPCNAVEKALDLVGAAIDTLGPFSVSGAAPLIGVEGVAGLGIDASVTRRTDASVSGYIGGGLVVGYSGGGDALRLGSTIFSRSWATGSGASGYGIRASVNLQPIPGIPIGIKLSGFKNDAGSSFSAGIGPLFGRSAALTYGRSGTFVSGMGERVPCE